MSMKISSQLTYMKRQQHIYCAPDKPQHVSICILCLTFSAHDKKRYSMDTQGNWKELAAQKEREWKEVTELRYY